MSTTLDRSGRAVDTRSPARMGHIPALDGLRGVAVLGVLAFHAGHLRGGYLGVDLFFVLSGFLITSLLLLEWQWAGSIDLLAFWGRRFRRLLPALLAVLAAVTVYAAVQLPDTALAELRRSGLGTLGYVANWVAIDGGSDYWTGFQSPSLLQHAWSLAIEEQFYLVWPVLALLGLRLSRGRRGPLLAGTTLLAAGSLIALWGLHQPGDDTARAYYGTDTRAAAILYGALVALLLTGRDRGPWQVHERVLGFAALPAAIVLGVLWATMPGSSDSLYSWGLPVAGLCAAGVIAAVSGPAAGPLGTVLSCGPLRWMGAVSYGLYLWHWPVFVILDAERMGFGGYLLTAVRVSVSLALAVASLWLVEQPVRSGRLPHRQWRWGGPVAAAAIGCGLLVVTAGSVAQTGSVGDRVVVLGDDAGTPAARSLLLIGDSQALVLAMAAPEAVAGLPVVADAVLGCGIGPGVAASGGEPVVREDGVHACDPIVDGWVARVERERPEIVVLHTGAWDVLDRDVDGKVVAFGTDEWDALTRENLRAVLTRLQAGGSRLAVLTSPCFAPVGAGGGPVERGERARVDRWNQHLRLAAAETGAAVIDYGALLCPDGTHREETGGTTLRADGVHLTEGGAQWAWEWLSPQLTEILRASAPGAAAQH